MTFTHALATNRYGEADLIVSTSAANGTHTTLASAMSAAVSGQTIFLRDSVTENVTITAGVNISAWVGSTLNTPTITGTLTMTGAGTSTVSGIRLTTNSAAIIAVTGSAASILNIKNCYLNCTNNTGITFSVSNASAKINIDDSKGDLGTTGIALFAHSSTGSMLINNTFFTNSGASTTASTVSAGGIFDSYFSQYSNPITMSSTSGTTFEHCVFTTSAQNVTSLTLGGSTHSLKFCRVDSGSASAISIGSSNAMVSMCEISSTNTNALTGAGTLIYDQIGMLSTSTAMNVTTNTLRPSFSGGISFDKGANTLNSYSIGTWTPTIVPSGTAFTSITYSAQSGTWTKIGNMVTVHAYVAVSAVTIGSATGDLNFPLPFAVSASDTTVVVGPMRCDNQAISGKYVYASCGASATAVAAQMTSTSAATTNLPASGATNTMAFSFAVTYRF